MASLCKNLRLARLAAKSVNHRLGAKRPFTASTIYSLRPLLIPLRPHLGANPQSTNNLEHRAIHNITLTPPAKADFAEAIMEMREASPAHFLIKIDSFSLLEKRGIDEYETGEFKAGGYKWKLIIHPNAGKDGDNVSVNLAMADTKALPANWEVNACFSICLFNHIFGNFRYALGRTRRFQALKPQWGFTKFISKKDLTDPSNGYLIDDKCVFGAEVFVNENKAITECLSLENVDTAPHKQEFKILRDVWASGKVWNSDEFTVGGHKWRFLAFLNGGREASGRALGLSVVYVPSDNLCERVKASLTICLKNKAYSDEHHIKATTSYWFSASARGWGWNSFIDIASLTDPSRGFIVNDCCRVEVEISVQAIAG